MIAFCCLTDDHDAFRAGAAVGLRTIVEADSMLVRRHAVDSPSEACNEMLARAAEHDDLEAAIFVDEHSSIERGDLLAGLRRALGDPRVAVVGVAPAPEIPRLLASQESPPRDGTDDVKAVDGSLLALSPWAVRELRFDPAFDRLFDGAAIDLCLQARARERRVAACGLGVRREPVAAMDVWRSAAERLSAKWRQ